MPMRYSLLLGYAVLIVVASSGFSAISGLPSSFDPVAMGPSEQPIEDRRVKRIEALEMLLAQSDEEKQAELIYLASIEFIGSLRKMRRDARPSQSAELDDDLLDPRSYRVRIKHDGDVIYVTFVPKDEAIRGGGAEVGIEKDSGRMVSIQPLM